MSDPLSRETLEDIQVQNLNMLIEITECMPEFREVCVPSALVYDAIQIMNNMYIQGVTQLERQQG